MALEQCLVHRWAYPVRQLAILSFIAATSWFGSGFGFGFRSFPFPFSFPPTDASAPDQSWDPMPFPLWNSSLNNRLCFAMFAFSLTIVECWRVGLTTCTNRILKDHLKTSEVRVQWWPADSRLYLDQPPRHQFQGQCVANVDLVNFQSSPQHITDYSMVMACHTVDVYSTAFSPRQMVRC